MLRAKSPLKPRVVRFNDGVEKYVNMGITEYSLMSVCWEKQLRAVHKNKRTKEKDERHISVSLQIRAACGNRMKAPEKCPAAACASGAATFEPENDPISKPEAEISQ